jgi:hypothetical protein
MMLHCKSRAVVITNLQCSWTIVLHCKSRGTLTASKMFSFVLDALKVLSNKNYHKLKEVTIYRYSFKLWSRKYFTKFSLPHHVQCKNLFSNELVLSFGCDRTLSMTVQKTSNGLSIFLLFYYTHDPIVRQLQLTYYRCVTSSTNFCSQLLLLTSAFNFFY